MSEKITIKEFANLLECLVCFKTLETDSFLQCENGHIVCQACYSKLTNCPVCRIKFEFKIKTVSDEMMVAIKSELRHIEDADGTIYLKNLMAFLKCVICQYCPTTLPTVQCVNGHLFCIHCIFIYDTCIVCGAEPERWFYRSLIVQKLLELSAKKCRFARHGCNVVITNLNNHEWDECNYKEVRCIFEKCSEIISMPSLLDHLEELNPNHESLTIPLSSNLEEVPSRGNGILDLPLDWDKTASSRRWYKTDYLKIEAKSFFLVCCSDWLKTNFYVYYLGLPKEAKLFGFNLRLYKEDSDKEIQVTGPVVSVKVKYSHMSLSPYSFKIGNSHIRHFWKQKKVRLLWEVSVFEDESSNEKVVSIKKPSGEWVPLDRILYTKTIL